MIDHEALSRMSPEELMAWAHERANRPAFAWWHILVDLALFIVVCAVGIYIGSAIRTGIRRSVREALEDFFGGRPPPSVRRGNEPTPNARDATGAPGAQGTRDDAR